MRKTSNTTEKKIYVSPQVNVVVASVKGSLCVQQLVAKQLFVSKKHLTIKTPGLIRFKVSKPMLVRVNPLWLF